jgi:RNA polymerase-binding protein DksA
MDRTEQIRDRLLDARQETAARLERIRRNVQRGLASDSAERAQELENQEVVDALGNEAQATLARIARALQRLDAGEYGSCVSCGREIHQARLEAYPYAERCIDCARSTDT